MFLVVNLFLLVIHHGHVVVPANAEEVGPNESHAGSEVETPDDELLFRDSLLHLGQNVWLLVNVNDVDAVPGSKQEHRNYGENAGRRQPGSRAVGVLGQPVNDKSDSDEQRNQEEDSDQHVPPVEVFVHQFEEDLHEKQSEKQNCESSDRADTTNDRQTAATLIVYGLLIGAVADAAAAKAAMLFLGNLFECLWFFRRMLAAFFFRLFLLLFPHESLHVLIHHHVFHFVHFVSLSKSENIKLSG